uniref:Kelch domain-containing protein 2 n=1 Tax=Schistosoma haematobium TaxID=6185 RepID=A0A094ZP77_SCHHA
MNSHSYSRHWNGVGDPVHPLSRTGHSAVSHGRYIYVLNGYGPSDDKMILFERIGLTRYDIITNCIECLPIHWDIKSLQDHMFNELILLTSGNSAVLCPELLNRNNEKQSACIYTFGGFSLLACLPQDITGHQSINLTMLKSLQRRFNYDYSSNIQLRKNTNKHCNNLLPSPRDKFCMEYYNGKLYLFGGYGPQFKPLSLWPNQFYQWPYLYDPNDNQSWIICDNNGGWNNQLIIYDIHQNQWNLIHQLNVIGKFPTPRAAHCSIILPNHGWFIIFGGRGPYTNNHNHINTSQHLSDYRMGRLNDMYCFNINLMEWTKILTPLDIPNIISNHYIKQPTISCIWPCGRSWMNMIAINESLSIQNDSSSSSSCCCCSSSSKYKPMNEMNIQLFLHGGYSNDEKSLNDAYLINIHLCKQYKQLKAEIIHSTKEVNIISNNNNNNDNNDNASYLMDLNKQQNYYIESLNPMNNDTDSNKPTLINGYICSQQQSMDDKKYINLNVNSFGEILFNEQLYIDLIQLYYSIDSNLMTELFEANNHTTYNNNSSSNMLDNLNLFLHDFNYHLYMYQNSSFTVHNHYNYQPDKCINPKETLYRIALLHTIFVQYLNENYCLYTINKQKDKDSKMNSTTTTVTRTNQLIEDLNNICDNYQSDLEFTQNSIFSTLISMFLKFMLPWQIIQMMLQEKNSWLTNEYRLELIHKLIPQCNMYKKQHLKNSSSLSIYQLDVNNPFILNKLLLLMTPNQIHNPINYSTYSDDRLLSYIQQTIMSIIKCYHSQSPFYIDIRNTPMNEKFFSSSSSSSFIMMKIFNKPIHRHWHTVTLGLDRRVYVIGGAGQKALDIPLECYNLNGPIQLTIQCSIKITKLILSKFLYTIEYGLLTMNKNHNDNNHSMNNDDDNNSTTIFPYSCHLNKNKLKMDYLKNLDENLKNLLNYHVKYLLEEWLL